MQDMDDHILHQSRSLFRTLGSNIKLTRWVAGTNPSNLGYKRARANHNGETEPAFETEGGGGGCTCVP